MRFAARPSPTCPGVSWKLVAPFLPPGMQTNRSEDILDGRMKFINQAQTIGWMPDWDNPGLQKLWQYNLHYFDWLWGFSGEGFDSARAVVLNWLACHPLEKGRVGWEPYPTALRLMNWCAFFFGAHREKTLADKKFAQALWAGIWLQTEWLAGHLESHLLGNHLLEDVGALAFVGGCFDGRDAERWREVGLALLSEQLAEQVLSDGLHFELSPMYHSRLVYLLLTLYNTGCEEIQAIVKPVLGPTLDALGRMVHADGQIALLNDSAFGIINTPGTLFDYGRRQSAWDRMGADRDVGTWALPDAGYYGYRGEDGSYIICDTGRMGPDYIPGHAHADIFTFELSLRGQRVIVDSGVHDYEVSEMRKYCRSTHAHNTLEINGIDQSEMWGAFRIARRGRPRDVNWKPTPKGFELTAWHDGYRRLSGAPVHHRFFTYLNGGFLGVIDRVSASCAVTCRSFLHLHPNCSCERQGDNTVLVIYPAGRFLVKYSGSGRMDCLEGQYCPEFYITQKNIVLTYSWTSYPGSEEARFCIEPQF